jgi:drug/metabolite transporter (DMT)-like permease
VGEALAVAALLLFSANVLVISAASPRLGQQIGFLIALVANVVVAALLLAGQALLVRPPGSVHGSALALFAVGGLLTSLLGRRAYFHSIVTIGPTRASTLQTTNPVFAALGGWVLLGQALSPVALLAGVVVLAGLLMVTRDRGGRAGSPGSFLAPGTGLALLGAAAYGLGNVARGAGVERWPEPVVGSLLGAVVGLVGYWVVAVDRKTVVGAVRGADPRGRALWLLSGVLTIGAQTCLVAATETIPVAIAVVVSAAVPVVVLPVGLLLRRRVERVGPVAGLGVLLVTGGVVALVLN